MKALGCRALLANRKEAESVSGHSPELAAPTGKLRPGPVRDVPEVRE